MANPDYRPFNLQSFPIKDLADIHVAIVRTEWNNEVVDKLYQSCIKELEDQGILVDNIYNYTVPGSYELPMGAKLVLTSTVKADAIICLGCVIQGQTKHDDYINHTIARSINNLGLVSGTPVIFGVLTTNSLDQAIARANGTHGDKGSESALAALKMISLKEKLNSHGKKISF